MPIAAKTMPIAATKIIDERIEDAHKHYDVMVIARGKRLAKVRARQEVALKTKTLIRSQKIVRVSDVTNVGLKERRGVDTATVVTEDGMETQTTVDNIQELYEQLTDRIPNVDLFAFKEKEGKGTFSLGFTANPQDNWSEIVTDNAIEGKIGFDDTFIVEIKDQTPVASGSIQMQ